jgi:acyl-CoA reductase-like NAD-dependent aldehyde dehydrogenase
METGTPGMTRPLWPLALAVWLGASPAMVQGLPPGCGERVATPRRAGSDAAARAAALRARLAGMSPEDRAALRAERAERRAARQARLAARRGGADPWTPKG